MGFEPTTPTLARLCSTPELRPRSVGRVNTGNVIWTQAPWDKKMHFFIPSDPEYDVGLAHVWEEADLTS